MEAPAQQRKHKLLLQAVVFGLAFGFLLQKAGVAKYHVLEGQLLFTDFTVIKVMLSAILVAMIGLYFLKTMGKIKFHLKPTKIASNVSGGLLFGVGFACAGYCPGTGAAGLGQGDIPALIFMAGLIAGSYVFAECSTFIKQTVDTVGDKGKVTLHTLLRINVGPSVALFAVVIAGVLFVLNKVGLR